jgi:peptide/nickel transport system substrate-binding protein
LYRNKIFTAFLIISFAFLMATACRDRTGSGKPFVIALDGPFSNLDPIGSATVTANDERLRTLLFNSLVKKNDKFDYVGELAKEIKTSDDGTTVTFVLQDNVKFHDGKPLTSADVKYTFDQLFSTNGAKASAFYDTVGGEKRPHILAVETPDEKTVELKIARPALKNQLLSNLVPVAIIPIGSEVGTQASNTKPPVGTGPYKFVSFDTVQNIVEVEKFNEYWEGAPTIEKIQIKGISDASALQAELKSQIVDLAPGVTNLSPDTIQNLGQDQNLKVEKFNGSNIQYLGFNTEVAPLNNVKVRQAIAYAIDRNRIINDLLLGQATIAHSILPEESWAYTAGTKYEYDPAKARQLLDEAGFRDTDGDGRREMPKISFKVSSGNQAVNQYTQMIQSQLVEVGIPVEIDSVEFRTMLSQLQNGQYQMTTGRWVGGNQDPIFLKDLFASSEIPSEKRASRNRSRYSNPKVDELLNQALNETDRERARQLFIQAQEIISAEVPMLPLWYPANMVVANKRVENIKVNASGDWGFVRNLTLK